MQLRKVASLIEPWLRTPSSEKQLPKNFPCRWSSGVASVSALVPIWLTHLIQVQEPRTYAALVVERICLSHHAFHHPIIARRAFDTSPANSIRLPGLFL